ncbi:uncharacterized protein LOC122665973 [Telopea speciosissima]|uniref:uncharacterized protein LOC122665973 n=1 Tax=Telopea speciosissima TaxID=54955 RepID=UPI001CC59272|nr:uncharacterized protein LOC122665973 [Telopea speciosissima]
MEPKKDLPVPDTPASAARKVLAAHLSSQFGVCTGVLFTYLLSLSTLSILLFVYLQVKFLPKAPPRRTSKPAEIKTEVVEDAEAAQTRKLLQRVTDASTRRGPRVEKKAAAQVTFYQGASPSLRTYNIPKGGSSRSSRNGSEPKGFDSHDVSQASDQDLKKEYVEPWNYFSYYPVTLPLRKPGSGDPEVLNEEEFGEAAENSEYNETSINPAMELGLMEESEEPRMLFLQLPSSLPLVKRSASAKGKETVATSNPFKSVGPAEKGCSLEELPPGFMGKMLVYKSGAIKLKFGEILYDVSPGSDCMFAQDVVAINTEDKHCCVLGPLDKHAVATADVEYLLNSVIELD